MKCTYCGNEGEFKRVNDITIKGKEETLIIQGGICKCGVYNSEHKTIKQEAVS